MIYGLTSYINDSEIA